MNRLSDYLDHMRQAAIDACSFAEGLDKSDFLADKRTQQAIILNLVIIGEAATKIMDGYAAFVESHPALPWRSMRGMRPYCAWLFRDRSGYRVGHSANSLASVAGSVIRHR